jgi:hypothetical protein
VTESQLAQWVGYCTIGILATGVVATAVLLTVALWFKFAPEFICRKPGAINIWSNYRSDIRSGDGERIKGAPDLRVTRLIGVAWRSRWYFGAVVFEKDDGQ